MTTPSNSNKPVGRIEGTLALPGADGSLHLGRGSLTLQGGMIAEVNAYERVTTRNIIFPTFTDSHLHLPQFPILGAHGMPLLEWLQRIVYPAEARWNDPAVARADTESAARRLIAAGTLGVAAYATSNAASAQAAIDTLAAAGLRGIVGQVLMNREAPAELIAPAEQQLHGAAALRPAGRITPAITPRFAIACTPELLAGAARLADETGWPVQTHLAETGAECARVRDLFGDAYLDVYREAGLLRRGAIFAHAIHLDDADRAALAAAGAIVAHCPTANAFLGSGRMDLAAMRAAGVIVALGSDIGAGPDVSMVRVARAMAETALTLGHQPPTPAECFWQITRSNADALGWTDTGRLEPGASADLLVIEPDIDWHAAPDPLGALLFAWDDRWIRAVVAQGRLIYGELPAQ